MSAELIHRELSYAINGCVFDVHNELGPGLREECYQKAMQIRLAEVELQYTAKPFTRRALRHRGQLIETFEPDAVVSGQVVLELKALRNGFASKDFSQALSYIKLWDVQLGMLVNFAQSEAIIRRLPNQLREVASIENYEWIEGELRSELRPTLELVRESLLAIRSKFGCGYTDTTYRRIVEVELTAKVCFASQA